MNESPGNLGLGVPVREPQTNQIVIVLDRTAALAYAAVSASDGFGLVFDLLRADSLAFQGRMIIIIWLVLSRPSRCKRIHNLIH